MVIQNAMLSVIESIGHYSFLNSYGAIQVVNEEIVATSFDNFVMPFINYKTGDHAVGAIEYFINSDIAKNVENIEGRTQDFLVSKDKRLVSVTTMYGVQYLPLENIDAIQIHAKRFWKGDGSCRR